MPLHLLGKKSWNVYNPANIARVKADEEAAAAREATNDQRVQELEAARRAAILRGLTPPSYPDDLNEHDPSQSRTRDGRETGRKRRKLAGENDTDMDIRLAKTGAAPKDEGNAKVMKLRDERSEAPLTDHAGNIDLFPVEMKEAIKREKNAEAEKEKKRKERSFEDQYTMRFSNAAGKNGLDQPWYTTQHKRGNQEDEGSTTVELSGLENKNVWGNDDPLRKEREKKRLASSDPLVLVQQGLRQLDKSEQAKKKWKRERDQELRELRAMQEREDRRDRHRKRKRGEEAVGRESQRSERHSKSEDHGRRRQHSRDRHDHQRSSHGDRRSRGDSKDRQRNHHGRDKNDHERSQRNHRRS